jgi:hypothetical protein
MLGKLDIHLQKTETTFQFHTCISINSKLIKGLNVETKIVKLIHEKIGNTLNYRDIGNNSMNGTLIGQQLRESIDKWHFMKLKHLCTAVTRLKRQPTEWEKIFASYTYDKGLITRIYRKFKTLTSQRINSPLNKWANELNRQFSKEVQMANKYMKKCSTILAI